MITASIFFKGFQGDRGFGWTENFVAPAAQGALPAALQSLQALAVVRAQMLGAGATIAYLRVSDHLGNSQVGPGPIAGFQLQNLGGVTAPILVAIPLGAPVMGKLYNRLLFDAAGANYQLKHDVLADAPYMAAFIRGEAGVPFKQRRTIWLRGNPDAADDTSYNFPDPGNNPVAAEWVARMLDFLKALRGQDPNVPGGAWQFTAQTLVGAPLLVTGFTTIANRLTLVIPGNGFVQGGKFKMSKLVLVNPVTQQKFKFSSGPYTVDTVAGNNVTVTGAWPDLTGNIVQTQGQARVLTYAGVPFVNFVPRRYADKDTGSPFDRPIAKAKKKRAVA